MNSALVSSKIIVKRVLIKRAVYAIIIGGKGERGKAFTYVIRSITHFIVSTVRFSRAFNSRILTTVTFSSYFGVKRVSCQTMPSYTCRTKSFISKDFPYSLPQRGQKTKTPVTKHVTITGTEEATISAIPQIKYLMSNIQKICSFRA